MEKERLLTTTDLLINIVIAVLEIWAGRIFNTYALKVLGYFTLLDIFEDTLVFLEGIFKGKRVNKKNLFGYGKTEIISLLIIGVVTFVLSIYIMLKSFSLNFLTIDVKSILVVILICILKYILGMLEYNESKDINSIMLKDLAHDNYYAMIKSLILIIFLYLGSIIEVFDILGVFYIAFIILFRSLKELLNGYILLNGENKKDRRIIRKIKTIINKESDVEYLDLDITSSKNIKKINISINVPKRLPLNDVINKELDIKCRLGRFNFNLIEFDIYNNEM